MNVNKSTLRLGALIVAVIVVSLLLMLSGCERIAL